MIINDAAMTKFKKGQQVTIVQNPLQPWTEGKIGRVEKVEMKEFSPLPSLQGVLPWYYVLVEHSSSSSSGCVLAESQILAVGNDVAMTNLRPCPLDLDCSLMGLLSNGICQNLATCITWADSLASRQIDHQLHKQDLIWHCRVCGYNWKSQPQSLCPRAPQYGPNRPYPGVAATKSELQKIGLMATRLPVGVAYSRAGKAFYDLYDLKAVMPRITAPKLRIFRICRLWKGKLVGVERTWKGMPEGAGWLEGFYTYEEAQQTIAKLQSRPLTPPEETWEWRQVPGLPNEVYVLQKP